eukprot:GGOE01037215.1.p1 GENE.GGOE01037215.1~~GGOE01037215.1.p1  ORF type:complete len:823 (+),score=173.02 GGOE01037215.1:32-2500(+)
MLDDEQEACAQAAAKQMLTIVAGPGSGKTRVIVTRIKHFLSQGIPASSILTLTYTRRAAGELVRRIAQGNDVVVKTFHSLSLSLLRQHSALLALPSGFLVVDQSKQLAIVKQIIDTADGFVLRSPGEPHQPTMKVGLDVASKVLQWIMRRKVQGKGCGSCPKSPYGLVWSRYEEVLHEELRALDFADLVQFAVKLLKDRPMVLEAVRARFPYILVDEFQDVNAPQLELLCLLSSVSVTVVGDPNQSIYGFRGALPDVFREFRRRYLQCGSLGLSRNHRSSASIARAADALIGSARPSSTLTAAGEPLEIWSFPSVAAEVEGAARHVNLLLSHGFLFKDIAILCRVGRGILGDFALHLRSQGIPVNATLSRPVTHDQYCAVVLGYIRLALNEGDDGAFLRVYNVPTRGLGPAALKIFNQLRRAVPALRRCSYVGLIRWLKANHYVRMEHLLGSLRLTPRHCEGCEDFLDWLFAVGVQLQVGNVASLVQFIIDRLTRDERSLPCGGTDAPIEDRLQQTSRAVQLRRLLAHAVRFQEAQEASRAGPFLLEGSPSPTLPAAGAEDLLALHAKHNAATTQAFLDTLPGMDGLEETPEADASGVSVLTIHQAKGLEWPAVLVVRCNEGVCPVIADFGGDVELAEERRLLYVAMTRAKQLLTLSHLRHEASAPSHFLLSLPPSLCMWRDHRATPSTGGVVEFRSRTLDNVAATNNAEQETTQAASHSTTSASHFHNGTSAPTTTVIHFPARAQEPQGVLITSPPLPTTTSLLDRPRPSASDAVLAAPPISRPPAPRWSRKPCAPLPLNVAADDPCTPLSKRRRHYIHIL